MKPRRPQHDTTRAKWWRERNKKERNFWRSGGGGVRRRVVQGSPIRSKPTLAKPSWRCDPAMHQPLEDLGCAGRQRNGFVMVWLGWAPCLKTGTMWLCFQEDGTTFHLRTKLKNLRACGEHGAITATRH